MDIVDRRLNPKAKSLGNRQRFLRRAKGEIRDAVRDAIKKRKISEVENGEKVRIRSKSLREPSFSLGQGAGQIREQFPLFTQRSQDVRQDAEHGARTGLPCRRPEDRVQLLVVDLQHVEHAMGDPFVGHLTLLDAG